MEGMNPHACYTNTLKQAEGKCMIILPLGANAQPETKMGRKGSAGILILN